jgi:hypothetical protein
MPSQHSRPRPIHQIPSRIPQRLWGADSPGRGGLRIHRERSGRTYLHSPRPRSRERPSNEWEQNGASAVRHRRTHRRSRQLKKQRRIVWVANTSRCCIRFHIHTTRPFSLGRTRKRDGEPIMRLLYLSRRNHSRAEGASDRSDNDETARRNALSNFSTPTDMDRFSA